MSITITGTPSKYEPTYNPIYLSVSSNLTSEESFNFTFDLYKGDTFINRDKLLPRPGTTSSVYSPARILESYLSYDLSQGSTYSYYYEFYDVDLGMTFSGDFVTTGTSSTNCLSDYTVQFGEEYIKYWDFTDTNYDSFSFSSYTVLSGSSTHSYIVGDYVLITDTIYGSYNGVYKIVNLPNSTSITINKTFVTTPTNPGRLTYSDKRKTLFNGPTFSGYVFNGVLQQEDIPSWDYTKYSVGTQSVKKFLTNSPSTLLQGNDVGSLGFLVDDLIPGKEYDMLIKYSLKPGVSYPNGMTGYKYDWTFVNLYFTASSIVEIGCYRKNLIDMGTYLISNGYPIDEYEIGIAIRDEGPVNYLNYNFGDNDYCLIPAYLGRLELVERVFGGVNVEGLHVGDRIWIDQGPGYTHESYNGETKILYVGTSSIVVEKYFAGSTPAEPGYFTPINYVTETKKFVYDDCKGKYDGVRFMFLNSLGQFDYFNATLLGRRTLNATRDTYTKTIGSNYKVGDRAKTVINVNSSESFIINTNWISEETATWLTNEFFESTEVYLLDSETYEVTPIILDMSSMEEKRRVNDGLINYTFNYSKSIKRNTMRN